MEQGDIQSGKCHDHPEREAFKVACNAAHEAGEKNEKEKEKTQRQALLGMPGNQEHASALEILLWPDSSFPENTNH